MTDAQWQVVHDAICAARDGGADEAYAAWLAVLDAIAEPSEAQFKAADCEPYTSMVIARDEWHDVGASYRAMIAVLRKETE